ncbi:MAG: ADP-ribosylation factor-like protein [Acidobacteriota bacterium]
MQKLAAEVAGPVPFVVLLNKSDLASTWDLDDAEVLQMVEREWRVLRTSAKTGEGVEDAFAQLTRAMLDATPRS